MRWRNNVTAFSRKAQIMKLDFIDKYNAHVGVAIAVLTAIFGTYWYLFAGYLILNVLDWLTGWQRAVKLQQSSSDKGLKGIIKKTGYWVIISVAFLIPSLLIGLGRDVLHVDLSFLTLLGWLTLAMLIVNEARSILENLVETGYDVPDFLIKGLDVTAKLLKKKGDPESDELHEITEGRNENKDGVA